MVNQVMDGNVIDDWLTIKFKFLCFILLINNLKFLQNTNY
jgi:hypothetical protein